jgi:hypothetical protein
MQSVPDKLICPLSSQTEEPEYLLGLERLLQIISTRGIAMNGAVFERRTETWDII